MKIKPLVVKVLDWRITVGLSALSLVLNLAYFYWMYHDWHQALRLSFTSLFWIGTTHIAHVAHAAVTPVKENE
jgi:hypothetical protein